MAANRAILDATIRHSVFLERLKSNEVTKFAPFLKEIDRSLRDRLTKADLTSYNTQRLKRLLDEVDGLLLGIFGRFTDQLQLDLVDIANYEAQFEAASLNNAVPAGVTLEAVVPTAEAIRTAILSNPLGVRGIDGGKLLGSFIEDWSTAERARVDMGPVRLIADDPGRVLQRAQYEIAALGRAGVDDVLLLVVLVPDAQLLQLLFHAWSKDEPHQVVGRFIERYQGARRRQGITDRAVGERFRLAGTKPAHERRVFVRKLEESRLGLRHLEL